MTLRNLFDYISNHSMVLVLFFGAIPALAFLLNLVAGQKDEEIWQWRYAYTLLSYLVCIPAIFAVTLNVYLFLFERQSIWDTNLLTQVLPVASMILTLMIVKRKIPFEYIPAFGKLSGFLTLVAALMGCMWFIDRLHIYSFTYVPFSYILVGFVALLVLIRFGWSKLF